MPHPLRFAPGLAALLLVVSPAAAQPPVVPDPDASVEMPALPLPGDADQLDQLDRAIAEAEAEIEMLTSSLGPARPGAWPDLEALSEISPIRTVLHPADRSIPVLTTMLRHTTLLLPADESIVDFVVGDAAYFDLRGADNVAYVKAMAENRRTQVTLVTNYNRAYSFDVFSTTDLRPDEVLTILWPGGGDSETPGNTLVPGFDPRGIEVNFASSTVVADYQSRIRAAEADALRIAEDGATEEARIRELGFRRFEEYLASYPQRIQFRYRLSDDIREAPLFVTQMWTDGTFTYLRSRAQESPALYSLSGVEGDEPVLVNVDLRPDGLYIVDHVMQAGYARLQGARGDWFVWDVPPVAMLSDMPLPRGGDAPEWVRTRRSLPWFKRHPRLTGLLVSAGLGTVALVKVLR